MNLLSYFIWHFAKAPNGILRIIRNYLIFCEHFFSIKLLLKSLFAPWKRITFEEGVGFSLSKYFEVIVSNLVSRFLGAIVRSVLIVIGVLAQIIVLIFGLTILIVFLFLPIVTLPIYYSVATKEENKKQRHELLKLLSSKPLPNLSSDELLKISKNLAGNFLFTRLLIKEEDIGKLDLKGILEKYPVTSEDVYEVVRWYVHAKDEEEEYASFWTLANILRIKPLARDWAYGYTINLDKYSNDIITEGYSIPHLVGRRAEIDKIQRILSKSGQNNVIVAGDPGSGRHAVVLAFALDVFEDKVMDQLKNKRVIELNLNLLLSEAKIATEVKGKVSQILKEARGAGNIILVIDNFERFIGGGHDSIDLTDVFSQNFGGRDLQVIAITDREFYHRSIVPNSTINKLFEVVEIEEISESDTLKVLEHLTAVMEAENKIFIPFTTIREILKKSELIANIPNPEKAIDVLKEGSTLCSSRKEKILTLAIIDEVISEKTKTPQGALLENEKEKLKNLEELLHQYVINQEQAINLIAQSLRRARLEIGAKGKPIGTFLFLGPTGVGKTETAKTLARVYFGSENKMIRIDMNQQQGKEAIPALLGNTQTNEPGILTKAVRDNPFTVVLLDEIEKASSEVLNLFLTILDEGYVNDSFGRRVSFENTIIIGTSNAGSEFIRQKIGDGSNIDNLPKELAEYVLREKIFSPEFVNRFDAVVVYKPLTPQHLQKIAKLMLTKLNERLSEKKISVDITDTLVNKIAEIGYDPQFGARPMKRVIAEKVEDYIARRLLNEEIKAGDVVQILI